MCNLTFKCRKCHGKDLNPTITNRGWCNTCKDYTWAEVVTVDESNKPQNENIKTDKLEELMKRIKGHEYALMDAPYFGWSREFIDGFGEALERVKKDILAL